VRAFTPADNPPPRGALDRLIRAFPALSHAIAGCLLYSCVIVALGIALVPSLVVASYAAPPLIATATWWRWPALGVLASALLFLWGFSLLLVVPVFNAVLPTRIHASSGGYFTIAALPWYLHNGLFYLVRFTVLPFVTLTPVGALFLRAMGMRMGKRPRIGTENLSDVRMITLGDDVAIGGSVHIFCHYGGAGRLVIAPVVIGSHATIGEKATIMGDVEIGAGATILAHAAVMPGTRVGPGERWGGAPARRITSEEWAALKAANSGLPAAEPDGPRA